MPKTKWPRPVIPSPVAVQQRSPVTEKHRLWVVKRKGLTMGGAISTFLLPTPFVLVPIAIPVAFAMLIVLVITELWLYGPMLRHDRPAVVLLPTARRLVIA